MRIRPSQARAVGYRFGGKGRHRDRLPADSRHDLRMRDSRLGHAQVDSIHQVPELGDTTHLGKDNAMPDMLSRARFKDEDGMVLENEEVGADFFKSARMRIKGRSAPPVNEFDEDGYNGEWLLIGRFLKTMTTDASMTKEEAGRLRKKAYRYFLRNGKIWRAPKRRSDAPL